MTGWHLFFSKQKKGIFLSLLIITACQEGGPSQTAGVFQGDKEQCVLRLVTLWCWAGRCEVSVILRDDTKHLICKAFDHFQAVSPKENHWTLLKWG